MPEPRVAPFGSWKSPLTARVAARGSVRLGSVTLDGDDTYWIESRPEEGGRNTLLCRRSDGSVIDLLPNPFNARSRVHEYGGGEYTITNGVVYFINFEDQRLYTMKGGGPPRPLTPPGPFRYADFAYDPMRERLVCVREERASSSEEVVNALIGLDPATGVAKVLNAGEDFYASPRLSPDGFRLAWLAWNHPDMPWDGTALWVADLMQDGSLNRVDLVAGGPGESIFQPEWSPDGALYFVSDRSGWWNLYRFSGGGIEHVVNMEAEFGKPQWIFGLSTYGFVSNETIFCSFTRSGTWNLGLVDTVTRELEPIETSYTQINDLRVSSERSVLTAGSPNELLAVVQYEIHSGKFTTLRRPEGAHFDQAHISIPEAIEFPTTDGLTAHGFFYPPANADYKGPEAERPPLLVVIHGGPTSATTTTLRPEIQFWTSRGFAILDVNYRGSTGFGRRYRELLNGEWGIVDVDDCIYGSRFLVERGDVDGSRLAIRGGSAGGFTTLSALTFRSQFHAGASYYGVSDLEALAKETHKFESRYLDRLIGPYPERRDVYLERSPIHHVDRLACPLILFHGSEDRVVPPDQSQSIYAAVKARGLPVEYLIFEGEQHGFRRADTIVQAMLAELNFYGRIFAFQPAE